MNTRWLALAVLIVSLGLFSVVATAPTLHDPGEAGCSDLVDEETPAVPTHGTFEGGMYAGSPAGTYTDCPMSDGWTMGATP